MKRTYFSVRKLYLLVVISIFGLTACDSGTAVNEANHEQTATPSIVPTETLTPTITTTPFPTFTPQPTQNPLAFSSNLISDFYTYDNFMSPFSAEDWENADEMIDHRVYSFSTQYGILNIDMNPDEYGNENFFLRIPKESLPSELNGISIDIPSPIGKSPRSNAGIFASLTDGNMNAFFRCYIYHDLDGTKYQCDEHNETTNSSVRFLFSIQIPQNDCYRIHIEWDPESGLVYFFLNDHVIAYEDLYNHEPIYADSTGIYISRNYQYAGGTRRFSNLQLGTYKQHDYLLPDDLMPRENQPVVVESSTNNDNYLYDDFNNPYYDQLYDYNTWKIQLDESYINNEHQDNLMGFVQKNGMMVFSGNGGLEFKTKDPLIGLRSVQFDVIAIGNDINFGETPRFQLFARNGELLEVEYICYVDIRKNEPGGVNCVSNNANGEMMSMSNEAYFSDKETNTITMYYEDATRELVAELNGEEFDRAPLTYEQKQYIDTVGLQFAGLIGNLETEQFGLDNVIFGFR